MTASQPLDASDLLGEFVNTPDMRALLGRIDSSVVELRFAEGLRRNWLAARAEASIQLAHYESTIDGARTDLAELRLATVGHENKGDERADPSLLQALDYWKAHHWTERTWPPLNTRGPIRVVEKPIPTVLGQVHKILTSRLSSQGLISEGGVAIPSDPGAVQAVNMIVASSLPAPIRAGLIIWLAGQRPAFESHSVQVARTFARHHLVISGFEPTGTLLIGLELARSEDALISFGNPDPRPWLRAYCRAMESAVAPTLEMIRHVQAGKLPD